MPVRSTHILAGMLAIAIAGCSEKATSGSGGSSSQGAVIAGGTAAAASFAEPWSTLISLLSSAASMIGNLADGVKKAVTDGQEISDSFHVRSLQDEVYNLQGSLSDTSSQQQAMIKDLSDYKAEPHNQQNWNLARARLPNVIQDVQRVTDTVRGAGSDLERIAGSQLVTGLETSLKERTELLDQLKQLPEPYSSHETVAFEKLIAEYQVLVDNTMKPNVQLDQYITKFKVPSTG